MHRKLKRGGIALACAFGLTFGVVACSDGSDDTTTQTATDTPKGTNTESTTDTANKTETETETTTKKADGDKDGKDKDGDSDTDGDVAAAFPVTVKTVDGQGNPKEFVLEQEPKRIVSASVSLTGPLLAIDAPVVATGGGSAKSPTFTDEGFAVSWADVAHEKGLDETLYSIKPELEKILAAEPDLVVMSSYGGDNATDLYDQIADIVPVIVVDYSKDSWQDVMLNLGKNLGREKQAKKVIADFDKKLQDAAGKITVPEQPTDLVAQGPKGMFFWTPESPQGSVMKKLGFDIAELPDEVIPADAANKRGDAVPVHPENLPLALTGNSVFTMTMNPAADTMTAIKENPELAEAPAVKADRVFAIPASFFRVDYYSANEFVDWALETFK